MAPNEALRAWRESAGLSLEKAAKRIACSESLYIRWEKGRGIPSPKNARKIAWATGIKASIWVEARASVALDRKIKIGITSVAKGVQFSPKGPREGTCKCGKWYRSRTGMCHECYTAALGDPLAFVHPLRQQDHCDCVYYDRCLSNAVGSKLERNPDHVCKPGCKNLLVLPIYQEPVRTSPIADCGI